MEMKPCPPSRNACRSLQVSSQHEHSTFITQEQQWVAKAHAQHGPVVNSTWETRSSFQDLDHDISTIEAVNKINPVQSRGTSSSERETSREGIFGYMARFHDPTQDLLQIPTEDICRRPMGLSTPTFNPTYQQGPDHSTSISGAPSPEICASSPDSEEPPFCFTPSSSGTDSDQHNTVDGLPLERGDWSGLLSLNELEPLDVDSAQGSEESQSQQVFWKWDMSRQRWIHEEPDGSIIECPEELD